MIYKIQILFFLFLAIASSAQTIEGYSAPGKSKIYGKTDVDANIPETKTKKALTYAVIIGNEDYKSFQNDLNSEANVDFAENDAKVFKEYVNKTMGVPEENITFLINATATKMKQAISKLNKLIQVSDGKAEVIFYYAGHGLPDVKTKEPYIMPVDVSGSDITSAIKVYDLYHSLTEFPSKKVVVFMDACFSGGGRNKALVAERAVKIKAKADAITGNIIAIASSSGEETSASYKEKRHGMFTYFLLKKLQDSKADIKYKELADFIIQETKVKSVIVNEKIQTPQIITSTETEGTWSTWSIK